MGLHQSHLGLPWWSLLAFPLAWTPLCSPPHPDFLSAQPEPWYPKGSLWPDTYQPQEGLGKGSQVMGGASTTPHLLPLPVLIGGLAGVRLPLHTHTKSQSLRLPAAMRPLGQPLPQAKLDTQGPLARRGRSRRDPRTLDSTQELLGGRRRGAEPGHPPGLGWGAAGQGGHGRGLQPLRFHMLRPAPPDGASGRAGHKPSSSRTHPRLWGQKRLLPRASHAALRALGAQTQPHPASGNLPDWPRGSQEAQGGKRASCGPGSARGRGGAGRRD